MSGADLVGKEVKLWIIARLHFGYPERGRVKQYLPDYPGGPVYEVEFAPGSYPPSGCLPGAWLFPVKAPDEHP